jgi:hypothetical protein
VERKEETIQTYLKVIEETNQSNSIYLDESSIESCKEKG